MGLEEHVGAHDEACAMSGSHRGVAPREGAWLMPLTDQTAVRGRVADQKQRLWQNLNGKVTNSNRP